MPLRRVPCPAIIRVDWLGDEAKMSPNCALLRLKPIEPALAMLFEMTDISVWAPLRPESDVKNDMDLSFLGGWGFRRRRGEGRGPDFLEQGGLRRQLLGNLLERRVDFGDAGEAGELRHLRDHLLIIDQIGRAHV